MNEIVQETLHTFQQALSRGALRHSVEYQSDCIPIAHLFSTLSSSPLSKHPRSAAMSTLPQVSSSPLVSITEPLIDLM